MRLFLCLFLKSLQCNERTERGVFPMSSKQGRRPEFFFTFFILFFILAFPSKQRKKKAGTGRGIPSGASSRPS
jgi:hypothetical protein